MSFSFIKSKSRGGQNLIVENFLFKKNKTTPNSVYFKCVVTTCSSKLSMNGALTAIQNRPTPHNHDSQEEKIEEEKFRQKVLETVSRSPATPLRQSYSENLQDMDENFLPPQYDKIRRGLSSKRSECMPPPPKNLQDISILESWRVTKNNQNFLLHQEEGILIFATKQGLEFLVRSKNILSDGTFKTAPAPFIEKFRKLVFRRLTDKIFQKISRKFLLCRFYLKTRWLLPFNFTKKQLWSCFKNILRYQRFSITYTIFG